MFVECEKMINEGAHFIDIGVHSSKPGSKIITLNMKLRHFSLPRKILKNLMTFIFQLILIIVR